MKTFKFLMPFMLAVLGIAGCNTDDLRNDIDELKNRVESLEAQVSAFNENINALKVLIDGKLTIQEVKEENEVYTLLLSNEQTITLKQGEDFSAPQEPEVTIENGNWVINGTDTGCPVAGDVPEFRIENNYWEVKIDGNWQRVKDANGNDVMAVSDGTQTGSNSFFESVVYDEAKGVLNIVLKEGSQQLTLPVVQNLVCAIDKSSLKNNTLVVGYGKPATLEVTIKGDNAFVTAPSGWLATLSEPNTEGKATLTVKAPAKADVSAMSRATADNSKDLTVQVNKGVNWAVDKIQVEAKQLVESYFDEFNSGNDIVIGEILNENLTGEKTVKINKTMYSNIVKVEENNYTITNDGIYFISSNVTGLTLSPTNIQNVALISDKPGVNVDCTVSAYLKIAGTGNGFIAKNINFKETEKLNYFAQATEDNVHLTNFVLDNCSLAIQAGKNFMNVATSETLTITNVKIDNLLLVNNSINIASAGWSATRIFNYNNVPMHVTDLLVANNKFYSYTENVDGAVNGCIVYANNQNVDAKIRVLNNTFVNIIFNSQPAIIGKLLSNVDFTKNIICINTLGTSTAGSCNIMNVQNESDQASYSITDNLYYRSVATFALTHYHSNSKYTDGIKENSMDSNPFEGGQFDLAAGTFVPNPTYSSYGAKFE